MWEGREGGEGSSRRRDMMRAGEKARDSGPERRGEDGTVVGLKDTGTHDGAA